MKQIIELSNKIKRSIQVGDHGLLQDHGEEFSTILINNFGDDSLSLLKGNEIKDFEVCALVLEYTKLHNNELSQLYFIINEVCSEYPELELLCTRVKSLNIPNEIGHIQNEWKNSLKLFLEMFYKMEEMSSIMLSEKGNNTFLDRTGRKVLGQIGQLLDQINMREELLAHLSDILIEDQRFNKFTPRILGFTLDQNCNDFHKDLFNLDQLYRNHQEEGLRK